MTIVLMVNWVLMGMAACHLLHSMSLAHPKEMSKYKPHDIWACVGMGPMSLIVALFIAVGFALEWDDPEHSKNSTEVTP